MSHSCQATRARYALATDDETRDAIEAVAGIAGHSYGCALGWRCSYEGGVSA